MKEEWRDIKGYEGFYQVSSLGRVKRIARKTKPRVCGNYVRELREKVINQNTVKGGYKTVPLVKNNITKKHYVHVLVANHFLTRKSADLQVDHKDDNPANNKVCNLQFLTAKKNKMKANKKMGKRGIQKRAYGKYRARINIDGLGTVNLGEFVKKESAYDRFYSTFQEWHGVEPW